MGALVTTDSNHRGPLHITVIKTIAVHRVTNSILEGAVEGGVKIPTATTSTLSTNNIILTIRPLRTNITSSNSTIHNNSNNGDTAGL